MAETPKCSPQPDLPPATSVAEEKKPSPPTHRLFPTHHSQSPWRLEPPPHEFCEHCGREQDQQFAFAVIDPDDCVIALLPYDREKGITALELADAALIIAAPRLLRIAYDFYALRLELPQQYPSGVPRAFAEAYVRLDELIETLMKAGVL